MVGGEDMMVEEHGTQTPQNEEHFFAFSVDEVWVPIAAPVSNQLCTV